MSAERKISTRVYDSLKWAVLLAWAYYLGRSSPFPRSQAKLDGLEMFAALAVGNVLIEILEYIITRRLRERRERRKALLSLIER